MIILLVRIKAEFASKIPIVVVMESNSVFRAHYPAEGDIVEHINEWSLHQPYLQYLPNVAHGWERWAQLDILFYLWKNKHRAHAEEYLYVGSAERMDLVVTFVNQARNPARTDLIELKAWSFLVVKELKDFFADVTSDAKKLIDGTYEQKYDGGYAWAIGLLPKAVLLDRPDSNGNTYKPPELIQVLTPSQVDELKKAHIQRVLRPFSDVEHYKDIGLQFSFMYTTGPLILVYWHSQIVNGKLHS